MKVLVVGSDYFADRFLYHLKKEGAYAVKAAKLPGTLNYDAVFLSGSSCTAENILRSLREGLGVFSEQIIVGKKEDIEIIDYARKHGLKLYLGAFDVFNPVVREIRSLLKNQEVTSIRIDRVGPVSHSQVNVVEDSVLHSIGTLMYILDQKKRPEIISCISDRALGECTVILNLDGTKSVLYSSNQNVYKERIIDVFCKSMRLRGDITRQELHMLDGKSSDPDLCMAGLWSFRTRYIKKSEPLDFIIRDFLRGSENPLSYDFMKNVIMATFGVKNIITGAETLA